MHHSRKALGKISKEFVEVAVCGDRLRNLQQSLIPLTSLTGDAEYPSIGAQCGLLPVTLKRGRDETMIFCARNARPQKASLDARSGRSISPILKR
jgi:hypothetical protein